MSAGVSVGAAGAVFGRCGLVLCCDDRVRDTVEIVFNILSHGGYLDRDVSTQRSSTTTNQTLLSEGRSRECARPRECETKDLRVGERMAVALAPAASSLSRSIRRPRRICTE